MATKKETYDNVVTAVAALELSGKVQKALTAIFDEFLLPRTGGATVNIDEVTRKDDNGNVVEMQCSVSGVWLPATAQFFYEDKAGKGINGLKRLSRQGEAARKKHTKIVTTSEKAIMADVLDGVISNEEAKDKINELRASKPDYSTVTAILPETEPKEA